MKVFIAGLIFLFLVYFTRLFHIETELTPFIALLVAIGYLVEN